jgi:NAD+ kinase
MDIRGKKKPKDLRTSLRIAVVGQETKILESELRKAGFVLDNERPNMAISFGGDGAALVAEQLYPGVPRLMIKHDKMCGKCKTSAGGGVGAKHNFSGIFDKLKKGKYAVVEEAKVEGAVEGEKFKRLVGLNEINVAHEFPIRAMRFDVYADGKPLAEGLIGDGVLVATPYGSTAYFHTITGRKFSRGLGIAFNNVSPRMKPRIVKGDSTVRIKINRGPALLCADNSMDMVRLKDGDAVVVKAAREKARIVELAGEKRKIKV